MRCLGAAFILPCTVWLLGSAHLDNGNTQVFKAVSLITYVLEARCLVHDYYYWIRSYEQVSFFKPCESLCKVKKVPWFLTSTTLEPGWSRKFLYVREAQKMGHDFWDQVQVSKHCTVILHSTVHLSLLMFKGVTWENRTFCSCNLLSELCLHMVTNKYLNKEHYGSIISSKNYSL